MAVNELSFAQCSAILNEIHSQATGKTAAAAIDETGFITQAQTVLKTGADNVMNAISQVLTKTIFSIRPYSAKLTGLKVSEERYGNHIRKINFIDDEYVDDTGKAGGAADGSSNDMFATRRPKVLQTNFYGTTVVSDYVTVYLDQLNEAFSSSSAFGSFIAGVLQNISNKHEQKYDETARLVLCNLIAAKIKADSGNVIHLLTEYNTELGTTYTITNLMANGGYADFIKWCYARIESVAELMSERSLEFHMNITGKEIPRFTPAGNLKAYMLTSQKNKIQSTVLADTFHDSYVNFGAAETINFWQSIKSPDKIMVKPNYIDSTGKVVNAAQAVTQTDILCALFDEEACGYTVKNYSMYSTPLHARDRYYNMWWNFDCMYWNDLTENAVIFCLD